MEVSEAFSLIVNALKPNQVGRSYLLCGDLRGSCDELVSRILLHLFPNEKEQAEKRIHPDLAYLEPEGKSRTIHIKSMREKMIEPMNTTAYSGGWRVGVIVSADRMEVQAANAFLKTLEEPPKQTVFFLLTDSPGDLLPTIISRTQRINLSYSSGLLEGEAYDAVAEVFSTSLSNGVYEKALAGYRLANILGELKSEADDSDIPLIRKSFYMTILSFVREWMITGKVERALAFRNIEAIDDAFGKSERFMPDDVVLCNLMDHLTCP